MVNLNKRLALLQQLQIYLQSTEWEWINAQQQAWEKNTWFVPEFQRVAFNSIAQNYLNPGILHEFVSKYQVPEMITSPAAVGIVMAGNIPLVGFHDFLCTFLSGHQMLLKLSAKDEVLMSHLVNKLIAWEPHLKDRIQIVDRLNNADAFIATGSNNSSRYFEYYFRKKPHIIRRNRSSVALLTGHETNDELAAFADDLLLYFGLGCRNVSKVYVPTGFDFVPLLNSLKKYQWMEEVSSYKNNFDYNLALHLLNNRYYMTNGTVLFIEHSSLFSPISQIHYEFYTTPPILDIETNHASEMQTLVSANHTPFGKSQQPTIFQFADGVDTMQFLLKL